MDPDELPTIRRALLRALYVRREAALTVSFLTQTVRRKTGLDLTDPLISTELQFLADSGWVTSTGDGMGGSLRYHSLTPDGVRYCEANQLTD